MSRFLMTLKNIPYIERLLYYFLIPDLVVRVLYEIGMRVPPLEINQPKQYIFYVLVFLDFAIWLARFGSSKLILHKIHPLMAIVVLMIVQGGYVGFENGNDKFRIFVDTVNVAVIAINLIRFTDLRSYVNISFSRIVKFNTIFCLLMVPLGLLASLVNSQSSVTLGGSVSSSVAIAIILARLIARDRARWGGGWQTPIELVMLLSVAASWNRTTLAVVVLVVVVSQFRLIMRHFYIGALSMFAVTAVAFVAFSLLPNDSRLAQRITGLKDLNLAERTGSIGERQAESAAIDYKIDSLGPAAIVFGAGHGATYNVQYTWVVKLDYANAHYGWSLFKLRYGYVGWLFLSLWAFALFLSVVVNFKRGDPLSRVVGILSLFSLLYIFTYSYFTFFIAGFTFVRPLFAPAYQISRRAFSLPALQRRPAGPAL